MLSFFPETNLPSSLFLSAQPCGPRSLTPRPASLSLNNSAPEFHFSPKRKKERRKGERKEKKGKREKERERGIIPHPKSRPFFLFENMDLTKKRKKTEFNACFSIPHLSLSLSLLLFFSPFPSLVSASGVFKVQRKFSGRGHHLAELRAHDSRRHGRLLGAIDLDMGGIGLPSEAGLYFAEIGLGTPSKKYYVQVDTGSDILWINCVGCKKCPTESDLGIHLTLYNPKASSTGTLVTCDQPFCSAAYDGELEGCAPNVLCEYSVMYGDGSTTTGYYVKDVLQYNHVAGNLQTTTANYSIVFG
ncbi:hypothetical protein ACLOJK_023079 [Asimina triloba]